MLPNVPQKVLRKPPRDKSMSDWLHNLPVVWMALVVFGVTPKALAK
jgi:hypothetical protein